MINPYYFFDEKLKIGFKINLSNIVPNFPDIGIETRYIKYYNVYILYLCCKNYQYFFQYCKQHKLYYPFFYYVFIEKVILIQ